MRASSRAKGLHGKLKSELGNSRGDIKYVVDKFRLLLRRLYRAITIDHEKEGMNLRERLLRTVFSQVNRKVTAYALDNVIVQMERLRPSPGQKEVKLPPCTHLFRSTYGIPCAHEIKLRLDLNEPLKTEDFHSHWWFNKTTTDDVRPSGFERVLNPNVVKAKGRPSGAPNKKKSNKTKKSTTERDSSQHEVLLAEVTGNGSQLKGIHRGKRLQKAPISKATRKAAAAKKATTTRKRNVETMDLTDDDVEMQESTGGNDADEGDEWPHIDDLHSLFHPSTKEAPLKKKARLNYFGDSSSSDGDVVNEALTLDDEAPELNDLPGPRGR